MKTIKQKKSMNLFWDDITSKYYYYGSCGQFYSAKSTTGNIGGLIEGTSIQIEKCSNYHVMGLKLDMAQLAIMRCLDG